MEQLAAEAALRPCTRAELLADAFTLHVGEPVALVAAPTRLEARQALAGVAVEWEPLAPVLSLEEAESLPPLAELRLEVECE